MLEIPQQNYMSHLPLLQESVQAMSMRDWGLTQIRFFVAYKNSTYMLAGFTVDNLSNDKNIFTAYFRSKSLIILTKKNKQYQYKFIVREDDTIDLYVYRKDKYVPTRYDDSKKWNIFQSTVEKGMRFLYNKINGYNLRNTDSSISVPIRSLNPTRKVYIPTDKQLQPLTLKEKYCDFFKHKNSTITTSLITRSKHLFVAFNSPSELHNYLPHVCEMRREVVVNQVELTLPFGIYLLPINNMNLVNFTKDSFRSIYSVNQSSSFLTLINRELTELQ